MQMAMNIKGNGSKTKNQVSALLYIQMGINMKEIGKMTKKMAQAPMFLRVVINMKGCLKIINMRVGEFISS